MTLFLSTYVTYFSTVSLSSRETNICNRMSGVRIPSKLDIRAIHPYFTIKFRYKGFFFRQVSLLTRVAPDTYLAGYPAAGYPANLFCRIPIRYPAGYPAE